MIKCKMCGGDLRIVAGSTVAECEYCGTKQTLPKLDDERKANLYDRAGYFRRMNDYDKAQSIYEQILVEDKTDADVYWSLVLCRYGIEYVEDPHTHKRIPTINRTQYNSVLSDADYLSALQYSDPVQKEIYEAEAKVIDKIQKGILSISKSEEPYDVFICYKETDDTGKRTLDSVLAQDLYHELTKEGFKTFFSRITLEDKLGTAYEPYIFAALCSAKVMVVVGTKPEHFNAVWVKNEWSRYLSLIQKGECKTLIPAYRDMNPYDLPAEFSHLQGQDMSKLGFMQDLVHGVKKLVGTPQPSSHLTSETPTIAASSDTLLRRALILIEDGNFKEARTYCNRILDMEPEKSSAYIMQLMIDLKARQIKEIANQHIVLSENPLFQRALKYADDKFRITLLDYQEQNRFYLDQLHKDKVYSNAVRKSRSSRISDVQEAMQMFDSINDWKDSSDQIKNCEENIVRLQEISELNQVKLSKLVGQLKIFGAVAIICIFVITSAILIYTKVIRPSQNYRMAEDLFNQAMYLESAEAYRLLGTYKDSDTKRQESLYRQAVIYRDLHSWDAANKLFESIKNYKDSAKLIHYHDFVITDSREATCTQTGYQKSQCICGESNEKEISKKEHSFSAATCTEPKKCKYCDLFVGEAMGHKGGIKCLNCGVVYASSDTGEITSDGLLLYNDDGVKITATSLNKFNKNPSITYSYDDSIELNLLIENNSGKDLHFLSDNTSVNRYMVDSHIYEDILNGSKIKASLKIYSSELKKNNITTITEVLFSLIYCDLNSTGGYMHTPAMHIQTSYIVP